MTQGRCHQCGEQRELEPISYETYRLGIPWLSAASQHHIAFACTVCGKQVSERVWLDTSNQKPAHVPPTGAESGDVQRKYAQILGHRSTGKRWVSLQYPGAIRQSEGILFPTSEGTVQDATVIDQYGDPDLMTEFAEEYLEKFWILMPTRRLPETLKEIMPPLLFLFTATETALKAYWIRSERTVTPSHSLTNLYEQLAPEHKAEIVRRFGESGVNPRLRAMGIDAPKVEHILERYTHTYGLVSNVHKDSRYYAEPTTMFSAKSTLHGSNLVKGNTPYPIFLPYVARALIDAYRFSAGPERLRRMGADLAGDYRPSGEGDHEEWGLVPSSLGLVVVVVSQHSSKDSAGEELPDFIQFKKSNPTQFWADWMYGGSTLLFYADDGRLFEDRDAEINGLGCRLRSRERVGLHTRDLNRLADALDEVADGSNRFGNLILSAATVRPNMGT